MYAAEFFSDTAALSQAEVGALVRIMCQYWRHGKMPDNLEAWALGEVSDAVRQQVDMQAERLDELRAECEALSEVRAKAARERWEKPEPMHKVNPFTAEVWPTFADWWDAYGKKVDRPKCEAKWKRMTQAERERCIRHTEAYVKATPDLQYRRHPITYLNNRNWEDEQLATAHKSQQLTHEDRQRAVVEAIAKHAAGNANGSGGVWGG